MYRRDEGATMVMPAELDKHVQLTVSHMINPCPCQDYWEGKLAEAVDSQRLLQEQVHVLLRRLEQADLRCAKTRVLHCPHTLQSASLSPTLALCIT